MTNNLYPGLTYTGKSTVYGINPLEEMVEPTAGSFSIRSAANAQVKITITKEDCSNSCVFGNKNDSVLSYVHNADGQTNLDSLSTFFSSAGFPVTSSSIFGSAVTVFFSNPKWCNVTIKTQVTSGRPSIGIRVPPDVEQLTACPNFVVGNAAQGSFTQFIRKEAEPEGPAQVSKEEKAPQAKEKIYLQEELNVETPASKEAAFLPAPAYNVATAAERVVNQSGRFVGVVTRVDRCSCCIKMVVSGYVVIRLSQVAPLIAPNTTYLVYMNYFTGEFRLFVGNPVSPTNYNGYQYLPTVRVLSTTDTLAEVII